MDNVFPPTFRPKFLGPWPKLIILQSELFLQKKKMALRSKVFVKYYSARAPEDLTAKKAVCFVYLFICLFYVCLFIVFFGGGGHTWWYSWLLPGSEFRN